MLIGDAMNELTNILDYRMTFDAIPDMPWPNFVLTRRDEKGLVLIRRLPSLRDLYRCFPSESSRRLCNFILAMDFMGIRTSAVFCGLIKCCVLDKDYTTAIALLAEMSENHLPFPDPQAPAVGLKCLMEVLALLIAESRTPANVPFHPAPSRLTLPPYIRMIEAVLDVFILGDDPFDGDNDSDPDRKLRILQGLIDLKLEFDLDRQYTGDTTRTFSEELLKFLEEINANSGLWSFASCNYFCFVPTSADAKFKECSDPRGVAEMLLNLLDPQHKCCRYLKTAEGKQVESDDHLPTFYPVVPESTGRAPSARTRQLTNSPHLLVMFFAQHFGVTFYSRELTPRHLFCALQSAFLMRSPEVVTLVLQRSNFYGYLTFVAQNIKFQKGNKKSKKSGRKVQKKSRESIFITIMLDFLVEHCAPPHFKSAGATAAAAEALGDPQHHKLDLCIQAFVEYLVCQGCDEKFLGQWLQDNAPDRKNRMIDKFTTSYFMHRCERYFDGYRVKEDGTEVMVDEDQPEPNAGGDDDEEQHEDGDDDAPAAASADDIFGSDAEEEEEEEEGDDDEEEEDDDEEEKFADPLESDLRFRLCENQS